MRYVILLIFYFISTHSFAQQQEMTSADILLKLQKLKSIGSVLYVAAHPDDENTRLLTYLANEKKLMTTYLSLTRGDGGQNLIGKEQGELLGLIRTQELLEARRTDGARQFFTRAVDFGFSKNPEETFEKWNYDSVLYDVVLAIRTHRPDVIICRFPTTGEGGHGHHTASAILAEQAFDDAANENKFPEQLQRTQAWQTKRLFWNTFNFGSANTISEDQLQLDIGKFNPLLGKYYGEIAADSRSMHKSQGFGAAKSRGKSIEYFKQIKGDKVTADLFENIVFDWNRFAETKHINTMIDNIVHQFNTLDPSASVDGLLQLYTTLKNIKTNNDELNGWLGVKIDETENLIMACSGLWADAYSSDFTVARGDDIDLSYQLVYSGNVRVKTGKDDGGKIIYSPLEKNTLHTSTETITIPSGIYTSDPYWLRLPQKNNLYSVADRNLIGHAEHTYVLGILHIEINDVPFDLKRQIKYKRADPVHGEVYRPLEIMPALVLNVKDEMILFTDNTAKKINVTVTAFKDNMQGKLKVRSSRGWKVNIPQPDFTIKNKKGEAVVEMLVNKEIQAANDSLYLYIESGKEQYDKMIEYVQYGHIQPQFRLKQAVIKPVNIDVKITDNTIGYIPGSGDDVAKFLSEIGYNVTILDNEKLRTEDLTKYNAIITGIRAFNTNEYLQPNFTKLMQYVESGGNLIVQYNTSSNIGPLLGKIGPYAFDISRARVTDENAEVHFILPSHPALNFPNKITQKDFENWVQERGLYFAANKHKAYESVLRMHDKNESPHDGSLIIAKYGKGNYVYTGISFFRQLPAGVPGAYRLLTNLISLPKNK